MTIKYYGHPHYKNPGEGFGATYGLSFFYNTLSTKEPDYLYSFTVFVYKSHNTWP